MKFKIEPEKSNKFLMIFLNILIFITCLMWLVLREYIYFGVFLIINLLIIYIYFFTSYIVDNKKFIVKLGFIKLKFDYSKILKVDELEQGVKLVFINYNLKIYPKNKDIFVAKINDKISK